MRCRPVLTEGPPRQLEPCQVAGIAVDSQGNIWIIHRPRSLVDDE